MAYRVSSRSLELAIRHLYRYGDTDVFPHLPEINFFYEEQELVVSDLSELDLDSYSPSSAIEALAPKSRFGFRIVHQLPALDTLLLLACVIEIGDKIEAKRQSVRLARTCSYRFSVDKLTGQIFRADRSYKDWLNRQLSVIENSPSIKVVVSTDISDFYPRINFHRLENLLDEVAPKHGAVRFIKKNIKTIRAKQSFGLPVGGSAARLLAELALIDTDEALKDNKILASRYVDDFRLFLKRANDPYDSLGLLAEQLGINEGLSLNAAKTSISSRESYLEQLTNQISDIEDEAEGIALDALTADIYSDGEPDEEDMEKLKGIDLVELLENEIGAETWDMGRIKVIFRALKIAKPEEVVEYIEENFSELVVFTKELCLLMEALDDDDPGCFDDMLDEIIEAIEQPPASSVQLIRTWLLELFVRGTVEISTRELKRLAHLPALIDQRQLLLIRGRCEDKNFFRKQKTAINSFPDIQLAYLVWGASCLPDDEYVNWLDTLKRHFNKPLGGLFLKWASKNKQRLTSMLKATVAEHPT